MYLIVLVAYFVWLSALYTLSVNLICHITFLDKILLKGGRVLYLASKKAAEFKLKAKIRLEIKTVN